MGRPPDGSIDSPWMDSISVQGSSNPLIPHTPPPPTHTRTSGLFLVLVGSRPSLSPPLCGCGCEGGGPACRSRSSTMARTCSSWRSKGQSSSTRRMHAPSHRRMRCCWCGRGGCWGGKGGGGGRGLAHHRRGRSGAHARTHIQTNLSKGRKIQVKKTFFSPLFSHLPTSRSTSSFSASASSSPCASRSSRAYSAFSSCGGRVRVWACWGGYNVCNTRVSAWSSRWWYGRRGVPPMHAQTCVQSPKKMHHHPTRRHSRASNHTHPPPTAPFPPAPSETAQSSAPSPPPGPRPCRHPPCPPSAAARAAAGRRLLLLPLPLDPPRPPRPPAPPPRRLARPIRGGL